jgi:hypothetical protein
MATNTDIAAAFGNLALAAAHYQQPQPFPVFFRDTYYPVMELSIEPDGTYVLAHPDHIDWYFYIREDDTTKDVWYVAGIREEDMDEISMRFLRDDDTGRWTYTNWWT